VRWLAALGNAGKSLSSETLVKWSHNPDTRIRSQSAYSLRFLRTSESEDRLSELLKDPTSSVRSRTIDAFSDGERHEPPQSLLNYTPKEPNDELRLRMVKALSTWHTNSPEVRRLFDQLEKSDKSTRVREFIKIQRTR
jgi:HEAT repeat protein